MMLYFIILAACWLIIAWLETEGKPDRGYTYGPDGILRCDHGIPAEHCRRCRR